MSLLTNIFTFGWFDDVIDVDIEIESKKVLTDRYTLIGSHEIELLNLNDSIKGTVTLRCPKGVQIWQYGVALAIETSASFFESFHVETKVVLEKQIMEEGYLSSKQTINFQIDPSDLNEESFLTESYCGDLFIIKVTVLRPWYTFNVIKYMSIALQNIQKMHEKDSLSSNAAINQIAKVEQDKWKTTLDLPDFKGKCSLKYDKICFNIGETFEAVLSLSLEVATSLPQIKVKLVFYRLEEGNGEGNEVILKKETLEEPVQKFIKLYSNQDLKSTVTINEKVSFHLSENMSCIEDNEQLTRNELCPSFYYKAFAVTPLSVRYFVRLVLECEKQEYWNTNEILIFRRAISFKISQNSDDKV